MKPQATSLLCYISHFETWNATPRKSMTFLILLVDARQHGGDRQGIRLQKVARTDARASFPRST
jgi:hypothetical protein